MYNCYRALQSFEELWENARYFINDLNLKVVLNGCLIDTQARYVYLMYFQYDSRSFFKKHQVDKVRNVTVGCFV